MSLNKYHSKTKTHSGPTLGTRDHENQGSKGQKLKAWKSVNGRGGKKFPSYKEKDLGEQSKMTNRI